MSTWRDKFLRLAGEHLLLRKQMAGAMEQIQILLAIVQAHEAIETEDEEQIRDARAKLGEWSES